jgi:hypothetical protein
MEQTLPSVCNHPISFFEAVDGETIPEWKLQRFPVDTTRSSYAVRLTKRLILRKFLKSQDQLLLFLEDDVVVNDGFQKAVQEAIEIDRDLVFLGGMHQSPPEGEGTWRRCVQTFNNHALLFSRAGAKKVLSILGRWTTGWSDRELEKAIFEGEIEAWCSHPWVAFQRDTLSDNYGNCNCVPLAETSQPWMLPDDLAVLDAAARTSKVVIEYGSGESTVHLASRLSDGGTLISIEHNLEWHEIVRERLDAENLPIPHLLLRPPRPFREQDSPWRYLPSQLDSYVEAPGNILEDESVDLVFVDGRERIRCALFAARILKPGGLLMIHDFWSRHRYRAAMADLLKRYDYLFDTPGSDDSDHQGMAVFRRKWV